MNDWTFAYGDGAYIEAGFDSLFGGYQPANQPELPVDNFWTEPANLITSNAD